MRKTTVLFFERRKYVAYKGTTLSIEIEVWAAARLEWYSVHWLRGWMKSSLWYIDRLLLLRTYFPLIGYFTLDISLTAAVHPVRYYWHCNSCCFCGHLYWLRVSAAWSFDDSFQLSRRKQTNNVFPRKILPLIIRMKIQNKPHQKSASWFIRL